MTLILGKSKKRFAYAHIVSRNSRNENGLVELELYFQFLIVVGTLRTVAFQSANINSHFVGKRFWKGKLNCCPRIPVLIILSIICICDNIWFCFKIDILSQFFLYIQSDVFSIRRWCFPSTKANIWENKNLVGSWYEIDGFGYVHSVESIPRVNIC